jgi:hypothetical protein
MLFELKIYTLKQSFFFRFAKSSRIYNRSKHSE